MKLLINEDTQIADSILYNPVVGKYNKIVFSFNDVEVSSDKCSLGPNLGGVSTQHKYSYLRGFIPIVNNKLGPFCDVNNNIEKFLTCFGLNKANLLFLAKLHGCSSILFTGVLDHEFVITDSFYSCCYIATHNYKEVGLSFAIVPTFRKGSIMYLTKTTFRELLLVIDNDHYLRIALNEISVQDFLLEMNNNLRISTETYLNKETTKIEILGNVEVAVCYSRVAYRLY